MRIAHVITRLIVGGAQENTLLSCRGQHLLGHEVTLVTGPPVGPEGSLLHQACSSGYRVEVMASLGRAISPVGDAASAIKLKRLLASLQPDVVHTHSSKAGIVGRWAAWSLGVPKVVHTVHGLAFTTSKRAWVNDLYVRSERWAARRCHRIACVADAMTRESLARGIGREEQYATVYSGVDTASFLAARAAREETRRRLGLLPGDVVLGTVARLFHMKGHEDLLSLASGLCAKFPKVRFLWVGDGLLRPAFEREISRLGLGGRVVLAGLVSPGEVPPLVSAMDILVHPSRREGLARAIVQGQLAGIPAVAYDIDGNREGMIPGETGFAIKPFDVGELGRRLEQLIGDEELRIAMGQRGRTFAAGRFEADTMVQSLERLYRSIGS